MTAPEFSARRIGRQWQIWRGGAFYCLASDRYGRAARTREAAEQCAARHDRAARDAAAWETTQRAARLAAARDYLAKRARRPRNLSLCF